MIPLKNDLNLAPSAAATAAPPMLPVVIGLLAAIALTPAFTNSPTVLAAWLVILVALIDNCELPTPAIDEVVEVAEGFALLLSD